METPQPQQLTCKQLVELVTDYLEGALPLWDRRRFDEHLTACPYCRIYLEQMRQTIRVLGHLPEETIPPEALEALLARFRGWRGA
jgi:predicted anti-sigma-YlaC factor YlaD